MLWSLFCRSQPFVPSSNRPFASCKPHRQTITTGREINVPDRYLHAISSNIFDQLTAALVYALRVYVFGVYLRARAISASVSRKSQSSFVAESKHLSNSDFKFVSNCLLGLSSGMKLMSMQTDLLICCSVDVNREQSYSSTTHGASRWNIYIRMQFSNVLIICHCFVQQFALFIVSSFTVRRTEVVTSINSFAVWFCGERGARNETVHESVPASWNIRVAAHLTKGENFPFSLIVSQVMGMILV